MAMGSNVTGFSALAEVLSEKGLDGQLRASLFVLAEAINEAKSKLYSIPGCVDHMSKDHLK